MWPFEHIGPNGQTYLHNDNWKKFLEEREAEYPHNWNHRRALITLCMPRSRFKDIPGVTDETAIDHLEGDFSAIFQPFPAHLRTGVDPDAKEPSWNLFIEDGHSKPIEPIYLFTTGSAFFTLGLYMWGNGKAERFAFFQNKYWRVWQVSGGGIGVAKPPPPPKVKKPVYRSLDDDWA